MLSLAHFTLGATTSVALCNPKNIGEGLAVGLVGGIAGIWPDCDLGNSKISKTANDTTKIVLPLLLLCILVRKEGICVYQLGKLIKFFAGIAGLLGLTLFCRTRPHREFTHSFLCCGLMTLCCWLTAPDFDDTVFVGYLSHLIIDYPNEKGEALLFPCKKRFSLSICKSNGLVNKLIPIVCIPIFIIKLFNI